jgi:hypothetical protein
MPWAVAGAAIGAAGSVYSANKQSKTAKELADKRAQLGSGMDASGLSTAQDKENQIWASDQNKAH